jgi:hypothetical protein
MIPHAHKWATPEDEEKGRSITDIHTLIAQQTGITADSSTARKRERNEEKQLKLKRVL